MQKLVFALVLLGALATTLASPACGKDACVGVTCEPITECLNGQIIPKVGPCGCCPACVSNTRLGVGPGKRCGPPTYLSCDAYLICLNGYCVWPDEEPTVHLM